MISTIAENWFIANSINIKWIQTQAELNQGQVEARVEFMKSNMNTFLYLFR